MFENKEEAIGLCLSTEKGTHLLYRGIGLNEVDGSSVGLTKRAIQRQISAYYPDVKLSTVAIDANDAANGQFKFNIKLGDK